MFSIFFCFQIFQGELTDRTVCDICDEKTDDVTRFWNLPLALVKTDVENYSVVSYLKTGKTSKVLVEFCALFKRSRNADASLRKVFWFSCMVCFFTLK